MSGPKRTRAHVLENLSRQYVEGIFPPEWICRQVEDDYGIDLRVEIVTGDQVTGLEFSIQLKATDHLKTSGDDVLHRCKVSTAEYFLHRLEAVMYVVYDAQEKIAYWLWMQPYPNRLDAARSGWRDQKTVGIRIPRSNRLTRENLSAIASDVEVRRKRIQPFLSLFGPEEIPKDTPLPSLFGPIEVSKAAPVSGGNANQILSSQLFGLISTRDHSTTQRILRYYELALRQCTREEMIELRELERHLTDIPSLDEMEIRNFVWHTVSGLPHELGEVMESDLLALRDRLRMLGKQHPKTDALWLNWLREAEPPST